MSNNILTEMDLITIKQEPQPQEGIERKYPNPEIEQGIFPIEPKQEEDVTSFLTQHQFIFNEDVDIKKEQVILSILLHDHNYVTKRQDSSLCEEQQDICNLPSVTSTTNFITEEEIPSNSLVTFKCAHCDFITNHKRYLISHMKVCNKLKEFKENYTLKCKSNALQSQISKKPFNLSDSLNNFTCEQCYYRKGINNFKEIKCDQNDFMSSYKKFLGIEESQRDSIKYKCDKCDLVQQLKSVDNLQQFICIHCGFVTTCKEQLVSHIKSQHDLIECSQCNNGLIPKNYLMTHLKRFHSLKKFTCKQCNYESSRKRDLTQHVKSVHTLTQFKCAECGFASTCKEEFLSHMKSRHSITHYKCCQCNYASISKNYLRIHMKDCHGFNKFTCEKCNYASSRKFGLIQHMKSVHNLKQFNCAAQCGFASTCKEEFLSHMKNQHGLTEHKCGQCNFVSTSKNHLKIHLNHFHVLNKFTCEQCNYVSSRKHDLVQHVKSIHMLRQFSCAECGLVSTCKEEFLSHKKNQHGLTVYKCEQCNYKSCRKDNLVVHIKRIHNFRQLKCDQCGFLATFKKQLISHIKSHHRQTKYGQPG